MICWADDEHSSLAGRLGFDAARFAQVFGDIAGTMVEGFSNVGVGGHRLASRFVKSHICRVRS